MQDELSNAGERAPAPTSPDAPTVLVVDDEPSNLASIEKIFQRDGMRVPLEGEVAWITPAGRKPYWRGTLDSTRYEFAH